jgi:hypothetical protein
MEHLQNLQVTVKEYFPLVVEGFQWLWNLFMFSLTKQWLLTRQYEELIDISTAICLKATYTNIPLIIFWASLKEEWRSHFRFLPHRPICTKQHSQDMQQQKQNIEQDMKMQLYKFVPDQLPLASK